jgi:hypothetical protein
MHKPNQPQPKQREREHKPATAATKTQNFRTIDTQLEKSA